MKLNQLIRFFTLFCMTLCGALALGQTTSGTISGTVADPQGNVVPGVTVTIKNLGTGSSRETKSSSSGSYRVVGLPPGRYEVKTEAQG
ncbi:MAG: carboxypeptidase-like regulatory domain-containing protein, partial [Nitrososphaerales archaeon]